MKARIMNVITLTLLFCLLLTAAACDSTSNNDPENTQKPASTNAVIPEKGTENAPVTDGNAGESTDTDNAETDTEAVTTTPDLPGEDIEIVLPELQETTKIILSVKNSKVLGASSLDKLIDSDIIDNYNDFRTLYGTVEGINEAFFEDHVLRLVHTAQSSSTTRYAVESVTLEDGTIKVEIIEQHAAMSTRDLRYWFVFVAVEKDQAETPVEVNVTSIQLTE